MSIGRIEVNSPDPTAGRGDPGLTRDPASIFQFSPQRHICISGRINHAFNSENFRRKVHGFREITGHFSHSREKEIAEAMAVKAANAAEPESEEAGHEVFVFGQGDHAVSNIARRQSAQFLAKPPGTSAIIGDRHDRRQLCVALFQSAKESRKTRAATY